MHAQSLQATQAWVGAGRSGTLGPDPTSYRASWSPATLRVKIEALGYNHSRRRSIVCIFIKFYVLRIRLIPIFKETGPLCAYRPAIGALPTCCIKNI